MNYVKARIDHNNQELSFKVYLTDAIKFVVSNTARLNGGVELTKRWVEFLKTAEQDDKSADEIVVEVMEKAGLSFSAENR